jgi:DNA modification methylase
MELDTVIVGDCLDVMADMPDECIDLIVADPPYGIGYASSWTTRPDGTPRMFDASFGKDEYDDRWIPESARLLKDGGAMYLFTRWDILHRWKAAIEATCLKVVQRIIWNKSHWKMGDLRYYGSQTEDVLFCRKGAHKLRWSKRSGNIWTSSSSYLPEGQWNHPTQKAEVIIKKMIRNSSNVEDIVADFHIGSGTTAVAALKLGRHFYGCDINPKYVELANERIEKARLETAQLSFLSDRNESHFI